jgi:hypothetical protein
MVEPEDRENFILGMNTVLFIDLLGVTKATKMTADPSITTPLTDLEFLWDTYLENLAEVYSEITIFGGSDSIIIVGQNYHEMFKVAAWIFQICWIVRGAKMRAGLDIGNLMPSKNYQKKLDKKGRVPDNFYQPPYYIGDALTHAVLAERKLRGNRIVIGKELNRHLEKYNINYPNIYLWKESPCFPFEVRWDKIKLAREVHKKLLGKFPKIYKNYYGIDSIKNQFNACKELVGSSDITNEEKKYYKKMIKLGKAWNLLAK